jgi:hypothetical protein
VSTEDEPLEGLLDESRLSGVFGIRRELGPRNLAIFIDKSKLASAVEAIGTACQLWGGGAFALIPMEVNGMTSVLSPFWEDFLARFDPDWVDLANLPQPAMPKGVGDHIASPGVGQPLLGVALNQERNPEDWRLLDVCDIEVSSPWLSGYIGTLGWLPTHPTKAILDAARFRPDLKFEDFLNIKRSTPSTPGIDDLVERLQLGSAMTPAQLSLAFLDRFPVQTSYRLVNVDPLLPEPNAIAERHGRQIAVIYQPGNVEDLCLLWNLRASHGQPPDLPLGLPATESIGDLIMQLQMVYSSRGGAFQIGQLALTSASIRHGDLEAMFNGRFPVIEPIDLLRPWKRPARTTTDLVTFKMGRARVSAWAPSDRDRIGSHETPTRGGGLVAHLEVQPQPLPPLKELADPGGWPFPDGYRHGGWEHKANDANELLEMPWPTGWHVLEQSALRYGLTVRPSAAGLAATALLRQLGGLDAVNLILSPTVVASLERLSERKGMSWFRKEVRDLAGAVNQNADIPMAMQTIDDHLAALRLRPAEDEVRELTYGQLQHLLRNKAATSNWLEWAEEAGVLIRGVGLRCERCGDRYWRALPEAVPPISCRGCGQIISRPFPPDRLEFRYRASEVVTQSVTFDTPVHLLAMRWFHYFFSRSWGDPSQLFGMYPGVEFMEKGNDRVIGESDLLLVMSGGMLVPGECKRHGAGLNEGEVEKLTRLSERVDAPWSFVATADRSAHCHELWRSVGRRLPEPPRFVLTAEHLFDRTPLWGLGANPFEWKDRSDTEWDGYESAFSNSIIDLTAWLSRGNRQ